MSKSSKSKSNKPKIRNISVEDLSPAELDLTISPYKLEFEVINGSAALANALRRCAMNEIPIKVATCHIDNYNTNDEFPFRENIIKRLNNICLNQKIVTENTQLKLNIKNTGTNLIDVHTWDFTATDGKKNLNIKKLCNDVVLCTLNPGKYLNMYCDIIEGVGEMGKDSGIFQLCYTGISLAQDIQPIDVGNNENMDNSSLNTDPHHHKVILECNGEIKSDNLLDEIIQCLIGRFEYLMEKDNPDTIETISDDVLELLVLNESHTFGNLVKYYMLKEFELPFVNYEVKANYLECKLIIRNNSIEESKKIYYKTLQNIINDLEQLLK